MALGNMKLGGNAADFHQQAPDIFVLEVLREQLRQQYFFCLLAVQEDMAGFVRSIIDAMRITRLGLSETEVVSPILSKELPRNYLDSCMLTGRGTSKNYA